MVYIDITRKLRRREIIVNYPRDIASTLKNMCGHRAEWFCHNFLDTIHQSLALDLDPPNGKEPTPYDRKLKSCLMPETKVRL